VELPGGSSSSGGSLDPFVRQVQIGSYWYWTVQEVEAADLEPGNGEVVEAEETGQLVRAVIQLANGPAKQTLGFLPDQGFIDRARKGTLLAYIADGSLLGYVLYDLKAHEVKIIHLCVDSSARRQGVARRLVDALKSRHSDRRAIVLACRHDYEATAVWEALEFRPQASRRGRSQAGHLLTIWVFDFGQPSLFDEYQGARQFAALDHNVFLDLHIDAESRPEGAESRYLLSDWLGEYIELCVTDEVFLEINRFHDEGQTSR
jgi:ribosomal protein S18 acetylase RimI-like enzyme